MGDQQDAPLELRKVILQLPHGIEVEVVGRLVQEQEIGRRGQQAHHGEPSKLSAGKPVQRHPLHGSGKKESFEELLRRKRAPACLRHPLGELLHEIEHREPGDPRTARLGKWPNTVVSPFTALPLSGAISPDDQAEERRLARPVGSDQPDALSAAEAVGERGDHCRAL